MTKKRSTKTALLSSVLSLLLCFSMLLGTTFAWFTDSVSSANNVIQSGNLDIDFEYWNGTAWKDVKGKSDILTNSLWEPGVTEVAYLRIKNAGTLAFKYLLGINIVDEIAGTNVAGENLLLSDYIQFGVVEGVNGETGKYADRNAAVAAVTDAKKISAGYTKAETMIAGEELYLALVVWMPTTVGNEANHNGENVPQIDLGINVVATQVASEFDSFDDQYDADAKYPIVSIPVPRPAGEAVVLQAPAANAVSIELPAALVDALPAEVTAISIVHTEPKIDEDDFSISFDSVEIVDQNGTIIDLEELGNTVDVNIVLPVQSTFAPGTDVIVYHDGVEVARTTVAADGTIPYEMNHLCEVTVSVPKTTDIEGFKAAITGTDDIIYLDGRFEIDDLANAVGGTYIRRSLTIKGGTIVRATGNYDGLKLYNSSAVEDYLVTFEGVTFESVKGGAVIVPGANTNVKFKNCEFVNLAEPSTGNTGIKINASNINLSFDGCTLTNMPVLVNYSYTEIKLSFTGCELNWRGTNCPGLIALYNNSVSDIDFVNCKITYDTEGATRTDSIINPKTSVGKGTTIDFDNVEIVGNSAGSIWYIVGMGGSKTQENVVVTAQDNVTYTFNGDEADLDTYLFQRT